MPEKCHNSSLGWPNYSSGWCTFLSQPMKFNWPGCKCWLSELHEGFSHCVVLPYSSLAFPVIAFRLFLVPSLSWIIPLKAEFYGSFAWVLSASDWVRKKESTKQHTGTVELNIPWRRCKRNRLWTLPKLLNGIMKKTVEMITDSHFQMKGARSTLLGTYPIILKRMSFYMQYPDSKLVWWSWHRKGCIFSEDENWLRWSAFFRFSYTRHCVLLFVTRVLSVKRTVGKCSGEEITLNCQGDRERIFNWQWISLQRNGNGKVSGKFPGFPHSNTAPLKQSGCSAVH